MAPAAEPTAADIAPKTQQRGAATPAVALRRFPYPYKAMLAICSDLDETPDWQTYLDIARFLNTERGSLKCPGLGLEVGNTIYFDMPANEFAYWNTDDAGRAMVRTLIHSGHIDCLHSYGDGATTRSHVARALDELSRYECRLEVWVDHRVAPTNFGADIMQGHGDQPGHEAYHADLTCSFGVRYVCRGRVTSVVGQDVPASLGGLLKPSAPLRSMRTLAKELAKQVLGRCGSTKYNMHASNNVLRRTRLRDGRSVFEFMRCNPHWGGVSSGDTADGITDALSSDTLDRLVNRRGACLLYTHLGKRCASEQLFSSGVLQALSRLSDRYQRGEILATTTHRLLAYLTAREDLEWRLTRLADALVIDVQTDMADLRHNGASPSGLDGITFYVPEAMPVKVRVNNRDRGDVQHNPPDETGRSSVSLPWKRLRFPDV